MLDLLGLLKPVMLEGESLRPQLADPTLPTGRAAHIEFARYEIDHDGFGGFQPMRASVTDEGKLALHLTDKVNFHTESWYFAENRVFEQYDPAKEMGITFENTLAVDVDENEADLWQPEPAPEDVPEPNFTGERHGGFLMRVYDSMTLYASPDAASAVRDVLSSGTVIELREEEGSEWAEVLSESGKSLGYAKDGFLHAIDGDCGVYATLPIEYGLAKTNQETYVQAYSHLVDIRQYFNTVESFDDDFSSLDLDGVDFVISMKLSTDGTSIGEPFYHRNLCLLQYDLLPMMRAAAERFRQDGYTIIIYDAYRPTSVQQRWRHGGGYLPDRFGRAPARDAHADAHLHRGERPPEHHHDGDGTCEHELHAGHHAGMRVHLHPVRMVAFSGRQHTLLPADGSSDR